jgi:hypothetical protein
MTDKNDELDKLAGEAAAVDAGLQPVQLPEQAQQQRADRQGEAALIIGIAKPLLLLIVPYIKDAPETEWAALQQPIAGLLEHYGVDVGAWLANPWAKLGAAAIPLAMRGVLAYNEKEKTKTKDEAGKIAAALVPGIAAHEQSADCALIAARG